MREPPACPYCEQPSKAVLGRALYPHRSDLRSRVFFVCTPCDARVGTHRNGTPLGRLANAELRAAKQSAHALFDSLWKDGHTTRHQAYGWLSRRMGLLPEQTHIGMFDVAQCRQVEMLALEALNEHV